MPQVCIKKAQHVFKSENSVQDAMKETWEIIQNGMCVSYTPSTSIALCASHIHKLL